ncbi:MAG: family 16 glycosylhydrolase [Candidatus Microthrix sp.]|nr:family 16 glycosylhydrolase [Candidatus Microthrix sp.]
MAAFWLVNDDQWPDFGEIDDGAFRPHNGKQGRSPIDGLRRVQPALHSPAAIEALTDWGRATSTPVDVTEWHTYAVEWAEGEIRFFIDDEQTAVHERPDGDEPTWPLTTTPR